jgi:hypothetical protein
MSLAYGAAAGPSWPKASAALLLTPGLPDLSCSNLSLAYGAAYLKSGRVISRALCVAILGVSNCADAGVREITIKLIAALTA